MESNFTGSQAEKATLQKTLHEEHGSSVQAATPEEDIKLAFIPPRTPHFGVVWEIATKNANY